MEESGEKSVELTLMPKLSHPRHLTALVIEIPKT